MPYRHRKPKPPDPADTCPHCRYSPLGVERKWCPACKAPNARRARFRRADPVPARRVKSRSSTGNPATLTRDPIPPTVTLSPVH